jgi:hypothetical protein
MGSAAGKSLFLLSALVVVAFAIALGADPKLFAGNEKLALLAVAAFAGFGVSAYYIGVRMRTFIILIGLIVAAYFIYATTDGSGDPLVLLHRLMGRSY